jgi:DNA-binding NtrC family response regulator
MVEEALTESGFETDILSSAEEALTLFKSGLQGARDRRKPEGPLEWMGRGEADREKEPAFPVVYMTGAAADDWASQGVPNSILLQKPFAPAQLVTAVSQLSTSAHRHPSVTFRLLSATCTPTCRQVKPRLSLQGSD